VETTLSAVQNLWRKGEAWWYGNGEEKKRRRSMGAAVERGRIFGVDLETAVESSRLKCVGEIPALVWRSLTFLNTRGIDQVGLYRVSGSWSAVARLREFFDLGNDKDLLEGDYDAHDVATLLKSYLRELPEPILTQSLLPAFGKAVSALFSSGVSVNPETGSSPVLPASSFTHLATLVHLLPLANRTLLHHFFSHLFAVHSCRDVNKMSVENLGVIFSPTLRIPSAMFQIFVLHHANLFPLPEANGTGHSSWGKMWMGSSRRRGAEVRSMPSDVMTLWASIGVAWCRDGAEKMGKEDVESVGKDGVYMRSGTKGGLVGIDLVDASGVISTGVLNMRPRRGRLGRGEEESKLEEQQ